MLCSTESMHPELSSSTGEMEHAGITWGGMLAAGFEGGTSPAAPAGAEDPAISMTTQPIRTTTARTVRGNVDVTARAPVGCCLTLPFAPLCAWNQISSGNVTFSTFGSAVCWAKLSFG